MQIEKYGHIITVDMAHKEPRKTIYSVKKKALVYCDTGEKVAF